ncbi:hypothetical protein TIFTF001_027563 [Ficus carica]|uniref:MULE transposase domain-containing protein n=1 Tax=Ficus carica TaxID=3494 RepID=A0AA88DN92_FICCA|nr:hypothetical protein TIFTF001_027563 [Ficus carica]
MDEVCVFVNYNGQWDVTLRYVGGEMKGILVPVTATYVDLIKLVKSVTGIRDLDKTIVMRYDVEPGMPPVRIQCDTDSAVEAMPPEVGESNHIDVQPSREGGQSDEAMQPVNDSNLIILPPRPPHIPSPTLGLDLHTEDGIEKNCILDNKKLLQYHLHHDAMSKHYLFKDEFGVSFNYLRAWRGKEAALTSLRGDDAESYKAASKHGWPYCRPVIVVDISTKGQVWRNATCSMQPRHSIFPLAFGIVPSESNESWKWFFEKLRDSIGTRESLAIVAERHKGIKYAANIVYPDAVFGICVQHLAANLKTRYKYFKGPLKTYFDGASRLYLLSEHQRHMESIRSRNPDIHRYLLQANLTKWSRAYFNGRRYAIMTPTLQSH